MKQILLTGFEAFDGRAVNGSWLGVEAYAAGRNDPALTVLKIPVVWGEPETCLRRALATCVPDYIISFGEGKPGIFTLESLAVNRRANRPDNHGHMPPTPTMASAGPLAQPSTANLFAVRDHMLQQGFPLLVSLDAGSFICEETLYQLESLRMQFKTSVVVFAHVPPFGTELRVRGHSRPCDQQLLLEFVGELVDTVTNIQAP